MGWSGGSEVADKIWLGIKKYIPESSYKKVTNVIINALEDQDWDNLYECDELYELSGRKEKDEQDD